eukprot:scaffold3330_cov398-Pinguiococcus_pyrenoidosus.AAC.5
MDAADVANGVLEQHQLHGQQLGLQVVLVQLLLQERLQGAEVPALRVGCVVAQEAAKDGPLARVVAVVHQRRPGRVELGLQERPQHLHEVGLVLRVVKQKAVGDGAHALMHPETQHVVNAVVELRRHLAHALDDPGHVADIEQVLRLAGRGQERLHHLAIQLERGHGQLRRQMLDVALELGQARRQDALEDAVHLCVRGEHQVEHVETALRARTDNLSAAAGRRHGHQQLRVEQEAPRALDAVVPAAIVHPQSQQLQRRLEGRLGAGLLGQVKVVDEQDHLRAAHRSQLVFGALLHGALDHSLRRAAVGGRGEVHGEAAVALGQRRQQLLCQHRLACAGRADQQHCELAHHERRHDERVPRGIHRRH